MTPFCPECGSVIEENWNRCPECELNLNGQQLDEKSQ